MLVTFVHPGRLKHPRVRLGLSKSYRLEFPLKPLRFLYFSLLLVILLYGSAFAAPEGRPDADMQKVLRAWSALGGGRIETMTAQTARNQPSLQAAVQQVLKEQGKSRTPEAVAEVVNLKIPGPAGDLPLRVFTPEGEGPFGILIYFHGGGWVLGDIGSYEASARALANAGQCTVVSVGYRQAPEHPYPAALMDAYAATQYITEHAKDFGGEERRVAVGGETSGANLAAAVCLMSMARGTRMPSHQLLICPITNAAFDTPSYRINRDARPVDRAGMQWFFDQYLKSKKDALSPYVSILRKNAADLAPATVIVAELDPLRSEGEAYHKHLLNSAVESQLGIYSGVTQDFFGTGAVVSKAKKAVDFAGRRLRKAFTLRRPTTF